MSPVATCDVCPKGCTLANGQTGACRARINREGMIVAQNYGRLTSLALDPIEKKPLAAFHPGSTVLSLGSYGCNLSCPFCQNHQIADAGENDVDWREATPEELVDLAQSLRDQGCVGLAYTYNEPLVGYEFVRDCSIATRKVGLLNVLVSNGHANPQVIEEILPFIDAANIDLKGFSQDVYDRLGGKLETVQNTLRTMAECPTCHLEVTTLIVSGLNDSEDSMAREAAWLASLDPDIVLHVTRCLPRHRMAGATPTPVDDVYHLAAIARRHLPHVLTGNC